PRRVRGARLQRGRARAGAVGGHRVGGPRAGAGGASAPRSRPRHVGAPPRAGARAEDIGSAARALEPAARPRLHVFLATSAIHLEHKLKIKPAQALKQAAESVRQARQACWDVEFSAEDASRTDYGFLREV